ncbi:MAG: cell wall-binding repeat-containing protein [Actinomycetaceae bacterium]|nr:cell wall-binding repeat-containing protein [Actinomycetaceae bacterium]
MGRFLRGVRRGLAPVVAAALLATGVTSAHAAPKVVRIEGADRFATSAAVSAQHFKDARTVYVASGLDFPDALSAGAVAAYEGAPILLVGTGVADSVAAEIKRLNPSKVVIAGGLAAVSAQVETTVRQLAPGANVQRVAGVDRYETSALLASSGWVPAGRNVYVASGTNFPDALAGGAWATRNNSALLLVKEGLDKPLRKALDTIRPYGVIALGGEAQVSEATVQEILRYTMNRTSSRVFGADRFDTSAAIATTGWGPAPARAIYANGNNFPDALAAVPLSRKLDAPILLVGPTYMPPKVYEVSKATTERYIVGGQSAVPNGIAEQAPAEYAGNEKICNKNLTLGNVGSVPMVNAGVTVPILADGKPVNYSSYGAVKVEGMHAASGLTVTGVDSSAGTSAGLRVTWSSMALLGWDLAVAPVKLTQGSSTCTFGGSSTVVGYLSDSGETPLVAAKISGVDYKIRFTLPGFSNTLRPDMFQIRSQAFNIVGGPEMVRVTSGSPDTVEVDAWDATLGRPKHNFSLGDKIWVNVGGQMQYYRISQLTN